MNRIALYFLVTTVLMSACGKSSVPSSSGSEKYREDLSGLRPSYENPPVINDTLSSGPQQDYTGLTPENDVNKALNSKLDSIDYLRKDIRFVDGFTIQVYSGMNSEDARLARGKVLSVLPDSHPTLKFDEPNFKVKVGKYYSRIEAQKSYSQLRKKFPGALIIPERIYIQ